MTPAVAACIAVAAVCATGCGWLLWWAHREDCREADERARLVIDAAERHVRLCEQLIERGAL